MTEPQIPCQPLFDQPTGPAFRLGTWSYFVDDKRLSLSLPVRAMYEVALDVQPTPARILAAIAPVFRAGLRQSMLACLHDGQGFDLAVQVRSARGRRRVLRITGEGCRDSRGRVVRIEGACLELPLAPQQLHAFAAEQSVGEALDALRTSNSLLREQVREQRLQLSAVHDDLKVISDSIAHDLRAPLSSIDGFGHLLHQQASHGLGERGRHALTRIRAGCRQMGELTDGLLALANLTRVGLRPEPTELATLARAAFDSLRDRFPSRQVEFAIGAPMAAVVDPRWFAQVFAHLIGNAWKFTAAQPHGRIEVGCTSSAQGPVYFVRDNGIGFDMARAANLFTPFHRLHTPAEFEGIGIGLAIVQKVVLRHGGRIWAEAAAGGGACFYFTLGKTLARDHLLTGS